MLSIPSAMRPLENLARDPSRLLYMVIGAYVLSGSLVALSATAAMKENPEKGLGMNASLIANAVALLTPLLTTGLIMYMSDRSSYSYSVTTRRSFVWLWIVSLAVGGATVSYLVGAGIRTFKPACTTSVSEDWTPEKTSEFGEGMLLGETTRVTMMAASLVSVQAAVYGALILANGKLTDSIVIEQQWLRWLSGLGLLGASVLGVGYVTGAVGGSTVLARK